MANEQDNKQEAQEDEQDNKQEAQEDSEQKDLEQTLPTYTSKPNYALRRLFATAVVGGVLALGYLGFCNKSEPGIVEVVKEVEVEKIVEVEKPLNLENITEYVTSDSKQANSVLEICLKYLPADEIGDKSFLALYKLIRQEIEKEPSLIENMGSKGKAHLRDLLLREYLHRIGSAAKNAFEGSYDAVNDLGGR